MKKKIIFYFRDFKEKQLFEYVSIHLNKKKFNINFTKNFNMKSDIGFYASEPRFIKKINSKVSFISLGGMDQGKLYWPNLWLKESWARFDFGILPGKKWANRWKQSSWYDKSRPKVGVILTGWPKSENLKKFKIKKSNKLNTILYAPCFETDDKGKDVVDAIKNTKIKLLIKHLPWNESHEVIKFKDVRKNINEMTRYAQLKLGKKSTIINSTDNIMNYYNKADILITDESSVMYEALLYNLPSLSCSDWPMRTNNTNKPRKIKIDKEVCNYTNKNNLKNAIFSVFKNKKKLKKKVLNKKRDHFSYLDRSGKNLSLFLENYLESKKIKFQVKPKYKVNFFKSIITDLHNYFFPR